jgi:hypothetical protein
VEPRSPGLPILTHLRVCATTSAKHAQLDDRHQSDCHLRAVEDALGALQYGLKATTRADRRDGDSELVRHVYRYAVSELDQWSAWQIDTPDGPVYVEIRRTPGDAPRYEQVPTSALARMRARIASDPAGRARVDDLKTQMKAELETNDDPLWNPLADLGVWHTSLVVPCSPGSNVMRPLTTEELSAVADLIRGSDDA